MATILVVVHGMGVDRAGWAEPIVIKLNEVARRYPAFAARPDPFLLARDADDTTVVPGPDQVLVVPAGYDAELRARVEAFQRDTQAIVAAAAAAGIVLPDDVLDVLQAFENAGATEKNFFWTHAVDVLLYRFFPLVSKQLRVAVMSDIAKTLARVDAEVSVMAHSLGTAVVHEALSALARGVVPTLGSLRPPGVRLANLFMIANVSRVLEKPLGGDVDVYRSPVCPLSVGGPEAYTGTYFNFRHMLDPFPLPRRFEPHWGATDFVAVDRLLHVRDFDVHGWEHYLDHPETHIPILNAFAGFDIVDPVLAAETIAGYAVAPTPLCDAGMTFWVDESRKIAKDLELRPTVAVLLKTAARFFAAVQQARTLCGMPLDPSAGAIV